MTPDRAEGIELHATIAALPGAEVPPILLVTLADGSNLKVQATGVDLTGLAVGQQVELKLALTGSADGTAVLTLVSHQGGGPAGRRRRRRRLRRRRRPPRRRPAG